MLPISCHKMSNDSILFRKVVNMGIDSRLTGFTKSEFHKDGNRFYFNFDDSEIEILIRRLLSFETEIADTWICDIIEECYGFEIE